MKNLYVITCVLMLWTSAAIAQVEIRGAHAAPRPPSRVAGFIRDDSARAGQGPNLGGADKNPVQVPPGRKDIGLPARTQGIESDSLTNEFYLAALRAEYTDYIDAMSHRRRVFTMQLWSSVIIFVVVLVMVSIGLWFSYIQFQHAMTHPRVILVTPPAVPGVPAPAPAPAPGEEMPETNLKVSTTGFEVSSRVLGVIILMISFLFFYLYIQYVYPIHELTSK
jgi:hypothetical protein